MTAPASLSDAATRGAPFGAPPPLLEGGKNEMPPVRLRHHYYRVNKNSDANCIAGTRVLDFALSRSGTSVESIANDRDVSAMLVVSAHRNSNRFHELASALDKVKRNTAPWGWLAPT